MKHNQRCDSCSEESEEDKQCTMHCTICQAMNNDVLLGR